MTKSSTKKFGADLLRHSTITTLLKMTTKSHSVNETTALVKFGRCGFDLKILSKLKRLIFECFAERRFFDF